ncbi:uncharacterized protein HMPREF1541_03004 [Cyphellophora europaea CBS 101466]|uniref:Cyclin-like domain-containing protein n=1 Tax=Cyphellophora europaea (strain CBS 101466) TaxID=1220924 RepID=W2RZG4_CYPE1|nr:uncharacterized protein HMPREF1541_03004 [Cyphellophora europaea CBS 101466]ETN41069.1 hypothetical protein HMPREF1541_03004 [Cyphellophora europaea CBS 101466]
MPHYSAWGPSAQHLARLPPTPPEYHNAYMTPMSTTSDQGYYPVHGYHHSRHSSSREHSERYLQNPAYTAQHSSHAHPRMSHLPYDGYSHGLPTYQYATAPAPILPPIQAPGGAIDPFHYGHQEKKEEKPTGGVAQHLDYEMDLMASFVAEMAQKLVLPSSEPPREFRKYVSQILSSTRLPSSTIMLGLFYLASRMKMVTELRQDMSQSGTVYRMLTTCLLLGSKFLDDNTFQNKSWAEVSSIPVVELNIMELEWLQGFNWEIHQLMYEEEDGFFSWIELWHAYEKKAKAIKAKEMHKLAPLETKFAPRFGAQHSILMSPDNPIPPQYQQGSQYDTQWARQYMSEYSPPSAPHSGPATPEYYPNQWSYAQAPSYNRQGFNYGAQSGYQHTPHYQSYGYQQPWAHGANCGCSLCAKHSDYYFSHGGYPVQTVVG